MDAVVFDFDGVIGASMDQHVQAYQQVLEPLGIEVPAKRVFLLEGARSESIIQDLAKDAGVPLEASRVSELAEAKQDAFAELGAPGLYDGAADLVATIQQRGPTAVVTGTRLVNLERLIPDLLGGFQAVMSQERYTHDKPHPEPYSNAAQALGIAPERCIAVENALRGIESARAAGYGVVVAIATTLDPETLAQAGPDIIVTDHAALLETLQGLLDGDVGAQDL